MDIEELTLKQVRNLRELLPAVKKRDRIPLPFKVGDAIVIRTVTMIQVGRVERIGRDFIVLVGGGWVADTGRFSEFLAAGTMNEFEKAPSWMLVGRGAICDVFPWAHDLPKATK
jgi:hypothetical protein